MIKYTMVIMNLTVEFVVAHGYELDFIVLISDNKMAPWYNTLKPHVGKIT